MSFYVRKSLKAGPFRVNLSKSGIGVSAGVPGFRVGTGPRGNYVHMGRNGVYYRSSLPHVRGQSSSVHPVPSQPIAHWQPSSIVMEDVTGATPLQLAESSASDVLAQLNVAAKRPELFRPLLIASVLVTIVMLGAVPPLGLLVLIVAVPSIWWLYHWDRARRSVVVFYDVNDDSAVRFGYLVDSFGALQSSQQVWLQTSRGQITTTYDHKTNAGASALVDRRPTSRTLAGSRNLVTNIAVPTIACGSRTFYFLPDRILVQEGRGFGEVAYPFCSVHYGATRFIESSPPPRDAVQVGTTWKYVNVKGGPDGRFKDNPQLPVMQYGELTLANPYGFHAVFQTSRLDSARAFATALQGMVG